MARNRTSGFSRHNLQNLGNRALHARHQGAKKSTTHNWSALEAAESSSTSSWTVSMCLKFSGRSFSHQHEAAAVGSIDRTETDLLLRGAVSAACWGATTRAALKGIKSMKEIRKWWIQLQWGCLYTLSPGQRCKTWKRRLTFLKICRFLIQKSHLCCWGAEYASTSLWLTIWRTVCGLVNATRGCTAFKQLAFTIAQSLGHAQVLKNLKRGYFNLQICQGMNRVD